ncbi:Uncharacterised protein [Paenibacillus thiaminolyticus]|nr:Uncharacterised protein [Paenibacillus thiaminolyticus]
MVGRLFGTKGQLGRVRGSLQENAHYINRQ